MPGRFERRIVRIRLRTAGCLLLAALASVAAGARSAAAFTAAPLTSVSASSLPTNGYAQDSFSLPKTACGSEDCVAVGAYDYAPGAGHGLIMPIMDGIATAAVQTPLPMNAGAGRIDGLQDVSCWSSGSCVAVGYYYDSSGYEQALVVPITAGVPGTPQEVSLPANHATTDPFGQIVGVACSSSGTCVAVGSYEDTSGGTDSLAVTIDDGVAAPGVEVPSPVDAASPSNATLWDVACQADGRCVAVGYYYTDATHYRPLIVPFVDGTAGAATQLTQLPSNIGTAQDSYLLSVACPAAGTCSGIGYYYGSSASDEHEFAAPISSAGVPGQATEAPPPSGAAHQVVSFFAIGCQPSGACLAVGDYSDTAANNQAVVLPISNGVPAPAVEVVLPSDAYTAGAQDAELNGVGCPAAGPCLAVGSYKNTDADYVPLTVSFDGGSVGSGTETQVPADATTDPLHATGAYWSAGCAASSCAAAGQYANSTANVPFALSLQGQLSVSDATLAGGLVGADYSETLTASGAWGSYSWSITSGTLPAGLSLDPQTGAVTGRPTRPGSSTFTVQATGTGSPAQTAARSLTVTIAAARLRVARDSVRVRRNGFGLRLSCSVARCKGVARLEAAEPITVRRGGRRVHRHRTVVIATARVAIAAGRTRVVNMKLDTAGRRLLAVHRHLSAKVIATLAGVRESAGRLTLHEAPVEHRRG